MHKESFLMFISILSNLRMLFIYFWEQQVISYQQLL